MTEGRDGLCRVHGVQEGRRPESGEVGLVRLCRAKVIV